MMPVLSRLQLLTNSCLSPGAGVRYSTYRHPLTEETQVKKLTVPLFLLALLGSSTAFADPYWGGYHHHHHHRPDVVYQAPVAIYPAPRVVYAPPPPPPVYRERVVYRPAPAYAYAEPQPYYQAGPSYRVVPNMNRVVAPAVGAVAGGVIGSQLGRGDGRVVATAVGAVLGAIAGDQIGNR